MLLYAKSKIPILPIPNRSQFDYVCLVNFSTATGISFPKRKTELREQLSYPSDWQESSGLFVSYVPGAQEQRGPPRTQQTVTTCLAFPGVKSLHSPGRPHPALGWAKGSCRGSALSLPNSPVSRAVGRGRGSQLQDPAVLALHTFSFIIYHL